jgi:hypothetical protein
MRDVMGWATVALVLGMIPVLFVVGLRHTFSRKSVEDKYREMSSGGLVGVFDAVWSPSAHEAAMDRDSQQRLAVPAPTPDPGTDRITDDRRITIEVPEPRSAR